MDPLRLVRAIPTQLAIPDLNARLQRIILDFRTATQLSEGCNAITIADCLLLLGRLRHARQRPLETLFALRDGRWEAITARRGACSACEPPNVPRDAASFNPPTHTLGMPLALQVAAHVADGVGRARGELRGGHALAALVSAALGGRRPLETTDARSSLRLWSEAGEGPNTLL